MDADVRFVVYDVTMREGAPPPASRVAGHLGVTREDILASFERLADAHMLVRQAKGEILMAGPFSAVPTPFLVTVPNFSCYGNCIWDAFGIAAMLRSDATIDTSCADCGEAVRFHVRDQHV